MLCDHNTGQGHLRTPGKKGQSKRFQDLELQYMFLGQVFAKNSKNGPKALSEASKSVKNSILKSLLNPEMTCKVHVFYIFYVIPQLFLKIST